MSAELELFAERDFDRALASHGIGRIERPSPLALVGPIVRARVELRLPVEAVAACGPQLELPGLGKQLIRERELHGDIGSRANPPSIVAEPDPEPEPSSPPVAAA